MIICQLVRAFERGAIRDHRPNIRLIMDCSQIFHELGDSRKFYETRARRARRTPAEDTDIVNN